MISKVITPGKSFAGLCRYLYQNRSGAEVILSAGVRDYDHSKMAADFNAQAAQNTRLNSPVLHIILSWPPGESISTDLMAIIAGEYMEKMHIKDTQFAVVKHDDRHHKHLHLVINRVGNNGKTIKDSYIGLRGKKIAQQLTIKYGLQVAKEKDLAHTHLERLHGNDALRYELFVIIHEILPKCRNFDELSQQLSRQKIEVIYKYKGQTNEIQGISFCKNECKIKGSDIDRSFSYLKLQKLFSHKQQQSVGRQEGLYSNKHRPENSKQLSETTKLLYELLKPEFTPDFIPKELIQKKKRNRSLGL